MWIAGRASSRLRNGPGGESSRYGTGRAGGIFRRLAGMFRGSSSLQGLGSEDVLRFPDFGSEVVLLLPKFRVLRMFFSFQGLESDEGDLLGPLLSRLGHVSKKPPRPGPRDPQPYLF
jgi:hypothetical protein